MGKQALHVLPFDQDVLVFRANIFADGGDLSINDGGIARIFLDCATAQSEQGVPLNFKGRDLVQLGVPVGDIPGLNTVHTEATEHVFRFKKVSVTQSELPQPDILLPGEKTGLPENHSAYQLEDISLS